MCSWHVCILGKRGWTRGGKVYRLIGQTRALGVTGLISPDRTVQISSLEKLTLPRENYYKPQQQQHLHWGMPLTPCLHQPPNESAHALKITGSQELVTGDQSFSRGRDKSKRKRGLEATENRRTLQRKQQKIPYKQRLWRENLLHLTKQGRFLKRTPEGGRKNKQSLKLWWRRANNNTWTE